MLNIYLGMSNGKKIYWQPQKEKNPHMLIVGTSGAGKTETIKAIIFELKKQKVPCFIIDFHDDFLKLADHVLDLEEMTINPLECEKEETPEIVMYKVSHILKRIFGLGVQQEGELQNAISKTYKDKNIDLKSKNIKSLITFRDVKKNLETKLIELKEEHRATTVIETLLVRLRPVFETGIFDKEKTMEFKQMFKKTIVLRLKQLPTDELKYAVAEFFLDKLKYALYEKGKSKKIQLYCIVDEAHRLIGEKTPLNDLLRESRKYGMGIILSSQRPSDFNEVILANIGTIVAFQCRYEKDAKFISKQMQIDAEKIIDLVDVGVAYINFSSSNEYKKVKIVPLFRRIEKDEKLAPMKKLKLHKEKNYMGLYEIKRRFILIRGYEKFCKLTRKIAPSKFHRIFLIFVIFVILFYFTDVFSIFLLLIIFLFLGKN